MKVNVLISECLGGFVALLNFRKENIWFLFLSICYKKKLLSWYILGFFFSQKGSLILNIPVLYSSIINNYHLQPVYINAVGVTPQFLHFHTIFFPLNLLLTSYFWQFFVPNSIWVLRGSAEIPIAELLAGVSGGVILLLMEHSWFLWTKSSSGHKKLKIILDYSAHFQTLQCCFKELLSGLFLWNPTGMEILFLLKTALPQELLQRQSQNCLLNLLFFYYYLFFLWGCMTLTLFLGVWEFITTSSLFWGDQLLFYHSWTWWRSKINHCYCTTWIIFMVLFQIKFLILRDFLNNFLNI